MSKIYHNYILRPVVSVEKMDPESNVSIVGYIPLEKRIKDMMKCGIRLQASRAEAYDIPPNSEVNDDEIQLDPTRKVGFDLADASTLADDLTAKRKRARAEKKASGNAGKDDQGKGQSTESKGSGKGLEEAESAVKEGSESMVPKGLEKFPK